MTPVYIPTITAAFRQIWKNSILELTDVFMHLTIEKGLEEIIYKG